MVRNRPDFLPRLTLVQRQQNTPAKSVNSQRKVRIAALLVFITLHRSPQNLIVQIAANFRSASTSHLVSDHRQNID